MERDVTARDLRITAYLPPREVTDHRKDFEQHVAQISQIFGNTIALPYLHRLQARCKVSLVDATRVIRQSDIEGLEDGPVELLPLAKDETKFKLRCYDPKVFEDHITKTRSPRAVVIDNPNSSESWPCTPAIAINDESDTSYGEDFNYDEVSHAMDSVTLNSPPKTSTPSRTAASPTKPVSEAGREIRRRQINEALKPSSRDLFHTHLPSKAFPSPSKASPSPSKALPSPSKALPSTEIATTPATVSTSCYKCSHAILSLGPNTDRAIDDLGLEDEWIVSLRQLITSYRNTRWTAMLISWGLSDEDAHTLVDALLSDIQSANTRDVRN